MDATFTPPHHQSVLQKAWILLCISKLFYFRFYFYLLDSIICFIPCVPEILTFTNIYIQPPIFCCFALPCSFNKAIENSEILRNLRYDHLLAGVLTHAGAHYHVCRLIYTK